MHLLDCFFIGRKKLKITEEEQCHRTKTNLLTLNNNNNNGYTNMDTCLGLLVQINTLKSERRRSDVFYTQTFTRGNYVPVIMNI